MIMNPVIQSGGAEEKEYTITNNTQISFPTSAKAGEYVYARGAPGASLSIDADNYNVTLPYREGDFLGPTNITARAPKASYLFVMPASNVTIN